MKSGFGYTYVYEDLDSRLVPRRGAAFELTQTMYGAGGDATYLKTEAKAVVYTHLV